MRPNDPPPNYALYSATSKEVDAPAENEIELTPAMIRAGAYALSEYNGNFESLEDGAIRVWLAMVEVSSEA